MKLKFDHSCYLFHSAVELQYDWIIDRPIFQNPMEQGHLQDVNRFIADNVAFEISPSSGKFPPMGVSSFNVSFKPSEVCMLTECLACILYTIYEGIFAHSCVRTYSSS